MYIHSKTLGEVCLYVGATVQIRILEFVVKGRLNSIDHCRSGNQKSDICLKSDPHLSASA